MSMISCPSCGDLVPSIAKRCKHCFHDFMEEPAKQKSGLLGLLGLIAAMVMVGTGVMWYIHTQMAAERIVIDEETQSIVITRTSAAKTESTVVRFDEIAKVEYVLGGEDSLYEVVAVAHDGTRHVIQASQDTPLDGKAEYVANAMDKPFAKVSNLATFGDQ
jgi:hypothetical protein